MAEATLLADVYGLLLADIRANRARRLAAQARAGALGAEESADDESQFVTAMRHAAGASDESHNSATA